MDRIVELLVKSVIEGLEDGERMEIEDWLRESAVNRELYARLRDDYHIGRQYTIWSHTRNSDGWSEMQVRMEHSIRRRRRISTLRRLAPYISAAALFAGVFFLYKAIERPGADPTTTVTVQSILPGKNAAVIELETGQLVPLDDKWEGAGKEASLPGRVVGDSIVDYSAALKPAREPKHEKHTLRVPEGATTKRVVLCDGTSVWLNAGSTLTYPVYFGENERVVAMTGEGYFEVHSDPSRPFRVETQGVGVRVTGTSFNLMSYPDEGCIATTLVEGAVSFYSFDRKVVLNPGTQAVFNKQSGKISLHDVDTAIYTAWKDGVFEFKDMPISSICHVLSRWYDIGFEIPDPRVGAIRFTGTIGRNKSLAFILDLIHDTETIDYTMKDGKVIITDM